MLSIALVGALGDPKILRVDIRKLIADARRVIATARKAHLLEIAPPDAMPRDHDGRGTGEMQVLRSERDRMLAGELYDTGVPGI
jgi:hypothetical protein